MSRRKRTPRPPRRGASPATGATSPAAGDGVWLFGLHAVAAALANPARRPRRLLATGEAASALADAVGAPLPEDLPLEPVTRADLEALLPPGAVHQGVALLTPRLAPPSLADVVSALGGAAEALVLVLDRPSDPRNVGAVLRSAAAFGAAAVVVPDRHAPEESGVMAKAASGAMERVPLVRAANLSQALDTLKQAGFWCTGLDGRASTPLAGAELSGRTVLVLGAEGAGLRRLTHERCDYLARVPITDAVESLNLSSAAAVALYEWARRRGAAGES